MNADDPRIGTDEREDAIAARGEHLVAGRIDLDEYGDRAGRAAAAVTRRDLRPLFDDLPPPHPVFLDRSALPDELRERLAGEGALVLVRHAPGEIAYRDYRAPVWADRAKQVDPPFDHPLRVAVEVSARPPDLLSVSIDAGASTRPGPDGSTCGCAPDGRRTSRGCAARGPPAERGNVWRERRCHYTKNGDHG